MRYDRNFVIDVLLGFAITALAAIVLIALAAEGIVTRWLPIAGIAGLVAISLGLLVTQLYTRPDHLRAMQSDMILTVANETLAYMRQGLSQESAQAVCRIVLAHTDVAAVAITDTEDVLGFAGVGEDHHSVGEPILTRATHEVVETGEHRILHNRFEIGCPELECRLNAAIVVPLEMRDAPAGTLKFYYTSPRQMNETQIAMAEGLAQLLSTQLELSELDRQVELATRMELRALQAQINPHFLFNTINTIASLVRTDPAKARDLLRQFAAFYRRTLESQQDMVPLEKELEYARMYLSFEQARFGDRLEVHEEVDDDLFDLELPAFVIQPLVENAVQHGMRHDAPLVGPHHVGDGLGLQRGDQHQRRRRGNRRGGPAPRARAGLRQGSGHRAQERGRPHPRPLRPGFGRPGREHSGRGDDGVARARGRAGPRRRRVLRRATPD